LSWGPDKGVSFAIVLIKTYFSNLKVLQLYLMLNNLDNKCF